MNELINNCESRRRNREMGGWSTTGRFGMVKRATDLAVFIS